MLFGRLVCQCIRAPWQLNLWPFIYLIYFLVQQSAACIFSLFLGAISSVVLKKVNK